uniref:Uncharacterized protein n=1 Tax=viral metagenome TaxID=1070528 RepID=A0A6M3L4H5_9ZZZZ
MNDKQIEIMASCAEFLAINGMSRNFLYELAKESFLNRKWMDKRLGLNEDNDYRVVIPMSEVVLDPKDDLVKFVKKICDLKTDKTGKEWTMIDKTFVRDESGNKYRITKLLTPEFWKELGYTVVGRRIADRAGVYVCCFDCSMGCKEIGGDSLLKAKKFAANFRIWYGEQVKGGTCIILSCNPLDVLQASANSAFQSCYRPGGEWFNGVISSMLSPNTLISNIEEMGRPGYKIGRSWIYVSDQQIVCGRKYGSFLDIYHLYIRSYLYSKMGGTWKHRDNLTIGSGYVQMGGPGYLDKSYGNTSLISQVSQDYSKIVPIVIPKAICLFCGKKYNDCGIRGVCRACMENVKQDILEE